MNIKMNIKMMKTHNKIAKKETRIDIKSIKIKAHL